MLLTVDHGNRDPGSEWNVTLEGKLENGLEEHQILSPNCYFFRFLSFFEKIRIEFPGNE